MGYGNRLLLGMEKGGSSRRPIMIDWHERVGLGVVHHGILTTMEIGISTWPTVCSVPARRRIIAPLFGGMIFGMAVPLRRF